MLTINLGWNWIKIACGVAFRGTCGLQQHFKTKKLARNIWHKRGLAASDWRFEEIKYRVKRGET